MLALGLTLCTCLYIMEVAMPEVFFPSNLGSSLKGNIIYEGQKYCLVGKEFGITNFANFGKSVNFHCYDNPFYFHI